MKGVAVCFGAACASFDPWPLLSEAYLGVSVGFTARDLRTIERLAAASAEP